MATTTRTRRRTTRDATARSGVREALDPYRKKRDFSRTPEPAGEATPVTDPLPSFVVQKHAASRLHFDLRLELDGVMKSWAVPKGPSLDPSARRLAMHVEDHPFEYNSFEGVIPAGEYGGGTVMLWDVGSYTAADAPEDPIPALRRGLAKGKLDLFFDGARLRGRWALVRMSGGRDGDRGKPPWLLIKKQDEYADPSVDLVALTPTSIATGRSMEEIAAEEGEPRA